MNLKIERTQLCGQHPLKGWQPLYVTREVAYSFQAADRDKAGVLWEPLLRFRCDDTCLARGPINKKKHKLWNADHRLPHTKAFEAARTEFEELLAAAVCTDTGGEHPPETRDAQARVSALCTPEVAGASHTAHITKHFEAEMSFLEAFARKWFDRLRTQHSLSSDLDIIRQQQ